MNLESLLELWPGERSFLELTAALMGRRGCRAAVSGLDNSARAFFIAGLAKHSRLPVLIVTPDQRRAEKLYEDLMAFLPAFKVHLLPLRELFLTGDLLTRSSESLQQRLNFFEWCHRAEDGLYICPAGAVLSRVLPLEAWNELIVTLENGQQVDREKLLERLAELGYERVPLIEGKGQFSVRGEIIDIYPGGKDLPLRIELFEDYISSLRVFDPATQRSTESLFRADILPAHELLLTPRVFGEGSARLRKELEAAVARLRRSGEAEVAAKLKSRVEQHLSRLAQAGGLEILSQYFPYFFGPGARIFDYLPARSLLILDEPDQLIELSSRLRKELEEHHKTLFQQGELLPSQLAPFWHERELGSLFHFPTVALSLFPVTAAAVHSTEPYHFEAKEIPFYYGQWELFQTDTRRWLKEGYRVTLLAANENRLSALQELACELGLPLAEQSGAGLSGDAGQRVQVTGSNLENGFVMPSLKLAVVAESNLVPRRRKRRRFFNKEGVGLLDYRELSAGDYVVHEQHGIGKYLGLSTLEIGGLQRDYLLVKYGGADKLYIPVEQIRLIQKYIGEDGKTPRLHSLGSGEWNRLKNRVKASVQELAGELLALYAARQNSEGYAFAKDHPWQAEFEAQFPYEETPDQLQAITDVKADMEKAQPMDRLICGDVGYGKTEVALRAAFKTAIEGKQVAVLTPTTILAQQHYLTFQERFADFPFKVAQLSRFVPAVKQKEILRGLAQGRVDIIIGTHRLLSRDVKFNDLGLLIIDEEQRFGVRHKEKLKRMRLELDILTMTATPIPRTMHLSLAGARDLSIIETPPENRYPVQTFVVDYSEQLIREAIQRELNRQGQVYFVFNRVKGIDALAGQIKSLFPNARIAVGHGQMSEAQLEKVMCDFLEKRSDILVSTTIIEAGLDIPNVNTLIVYEADKCGLSQLYQLRGRVGRSNRLAYAFLTYRRDQIMSETSKKRLQAIKEFTELGSGFKIALRDLEIRGAGNILGAEQHGFVAAVGFDLYIRLLEQAVGTLSKGRQEKTKLPPRLDLKVNAFIPSSYINNQDQKIDFYQRIYTIESTGELAEVADELNDRYGSPPLPVRNLLAVARLKLLSQRLKIELIQQQKQMVVIKFEDAVQLDLDRLWVMVGSSGGKYTISAGKRLSLKVKITEEDSSFLNELLHMLETMLSLAHSEEPVSSN